MKVEGNTKISGRLTLGNEKRGRQANSQNAQFFFFEQIMTPALLRDMVAYQEDENRDHMRDKRREIVWFRSGRGFYLSFLF